MTLGSATSPANVTVTTRNLSLAVVSFQPPVYGGQCVDHYTVTAISEEGTDTCTVTNDHHMETFTCSFSILNTTDYNFTVSSVTIGLNGTLYHGDTSTAVLVTMSDDLSDGMNVTFQEPGLDVTGTVVPDNTADRTIPIAVGTIVIGVLLAVVALVGLLVVGMNVKEKQTSEQVAVQGMCVCFICMHEYIILWWCIYTCTLSSSEHYR